MKIKIMKLEGIDVTIPTRGTEKSGGIDFYIPNFTKKQFKDIFSKQEGIETKGYNMIIIKPHNHILIPSGLKVGIPRNKLLQFNPRSSIGSKLQVLMGARVIDEDYRNEVFINLINTSDEKVTITLGQKIAQALLLPAYYCKIEECNSEKKLFGRTKSNRKGGFGSTDSK